MAPNREDFLHFELLNCEETELYILNKTGAQLVVRFMESFMITSCNKFLRFIGFILFEIWV